MEKKRLARMPIRVVFYRDRSDKSIWIAHCLEFDLMGHGPDWAKAMAMLTEAIGMQLEHTLKSSNIKNLFTPAPAEYQMMFAQGKDVAKTHLVVELHFADFEIDEVEGREYEDEDAGYLFSASGAEWAVGAGGCPHIIAEKTTPSAEGIRR